MPPSALVVVFHSDTLEAGSPEFEVAAAQAMRNVPDAPHVARVVSHLLSPRQVSADRHTAYDIVLLDLMLPHLSGFDVLRHLVVRRSDLLKRTFIMTAATDESPPPDQDEPHT